MLSRQAENELKLPDNHNSQPGPYLPSLSASSRTLLARLNTFQPRPHFFEAAKRVPSFVFLRHRGYSPSTHDSVSRKTKTCPAKFSVDITRLDL